MEQFITLANIQVEHTYYTTPVNRHLKLISTPEPTKPLAYQWEYLFVVRHDTSKNIDDLLLEETKKSILFNKAERLEHSSFGTNVWRIVSTTPVNALERPDYSLILSMVLQEYPLKKRIVSRECPQPGKYISDASEMLRNVCYI